MLNQAKSAFLMVLVMTVLLGMIYPLAITGLAQVCFHHEANGSVIPAQGAPSGSSLIGQPFSSPGYFWGRPSATPERPYNGALSSGSNLGPTNPALVSRVEERIKALRVADPGNTAPVPVDLVTASGSGLDPHISPAAAYYQAPRVARARGLSESAVRNLVQKHLRGRQFGILGEPVVNVLELNLALDAFSKSRAHVP
jgi:K+-transporting ATPase ATPase C chain